MNAMDRIDAVISVIGTPWKHSGIPLQFSSFLSQSCEQYHCQQEAKTCADGAEQGFHVVISICDILDRNTQYRTVSRDQRQEYTQRIVERRHVFLQRHFYQLYQRCDYQDEYQLSADNRC